MSAKHILFSGEFISEDNHAKFFGNWTTNKRETKGPKKAQDNKPILAP